MEGREKFTGGPSVLLDCAFGASERPGDLAEAPLLDEAGQHDALLVARQARDQVGEHGAAIGLCRIARLARAGHWLPALARQALPAVGDRVPGDLEQPGREWRAAPFEPGEVGERLVEDLCGQILGLATTA